LFASWNGILPVIQKKYFEEKGELSRYLQEEIGDGSRYFMSPGAQRMLGGFGKDFPSRAADLRDRRYIRAPLLYHCLQAGGFGEPLSPENFDSLRLLDQR
jgi:hypothetical protein